MKFAHLGDCHLGGWRFPEMQELNIKSFSYAIDTIIKEKVDLVLICGDLFDTAYPSIETLKNAFYYLKKLKEERIPCFVIAGSHDYSVSGKTFLEVLEHAGFCINAFKYEEKNSKIVLLPNIIKNYAIYGYPGKKTGIEVNELRNISIQDAPGLFRVFMLHTSLKEAIGNIPIESISIKELPKVDYYALSHLHVDFARDNVCYSGPIFPNNFDELEELRYGQFYIVNSTDNVVKCTKIPIKLKEVLPINIVIDSSFSGNEKIISELSKRDVKDKIVLLRVSGELKTGKTSEIKFSEIEKFARERGAYSFLKNISKLSIEETEIKIEQKDMHEVEDEIINKYFENSESRFKTLVPSLIKVLNLEKHEDEKNQSFEDRLIGELKKILEF